MRPLLRTVVGLGLAALIAGPALAQGQGRGFGRMGGMGGENLAGLAANSSVQKELKLEDQQVEKARELAEKTREKMRNTFQSLQGLQGEESRARVQEARREINASTEKALGEFLKPEQIARLKQISYQQRGAMAFSDPEVAKKLNLTDSQKTEIQAVVQETMQGLRGAFRKDQSEEERQEAMKKFSAARKEALAKAESKLNDEQQKTWKEMVGAPFEYKPDPRPNNR
jgi:hypothetical protein